ncbi:hypothetical protein D3C76_48220 [compost metagenome]
MSILGKIGDLVGSSLFKEAKEVIMAYWPPEVPPEKKLELQARLNEIELTKARQIDQAIAEAEQRITERIAMTEGSAQDLRAVPVVGPLVLFLRGLQRPIWGYATLWADAAWFMGLWKLNDQQESALWVINFLVLGFLFGERAVQNVAPLIAEIMAKRPAR